MRGIRARGHEVVGVCAEGPLLDDVRAEGFRVVGLPFARRISPLAHLRAFLRPGAAVPRRAAGPGACAHAAQRLPRPAGGALRRGAAHRLYLPRLLVQQPRPLAAPRRRLRAGVARRPGDRCLPDGVAGGSGGRAPPSYQRARDPGRQRPRPRGVPPRSGGACPHPCGAGGAAGPRRGHRRVAPGAPQGLPRAGRGDARGARRRTVGGGRAPRLGPRRGHGRGAARRRASARGCGCWAIARTSPPCWLRPTSSPCPAISRACRCR